MKRFEDISCNDGSQWFYKCHSSPLLARVLMLICPLGTSIQSRTCASQPTWNHLVSMSSRPLRSRWIVPAVIEIPLGKWFRFMATTSACASEQSWKLGGLQTLQAKDRYARENQNDALRRSAYHLGGTLTVRLPRYRVKCIICIGLLGLWQKEDTIRPFNG